MSMIGMGMYEILIILGLLGGGVGGLPMQPLEAPRDTAWEASAHVLPGAHVALHGNLEHAWDQLEGILEEVSGLGLVTRSSTALQGLAMVRAEIAAGAAEGQAEVGLDFRKDLGSVTVSVRADGPENVRILARARGRFGNDRLAAAIGGLMDGTETYKGVTLYRLPEREIPSHVMGFVDETTALLGPVDVVKGLIDGEPLGATEGVQEAIAAAMRRRGARALLWGHAGVDRPGAFLYLAPPAWMVDEMFKERALRHAAAALQGLRSMVHVSVFGRGTLTFDTTSERTLAFIAHIAKAASRLNDATEPVVDALFHVAAAVGPLLSAEEVGDEVVRALSDEAGLREAADWIRRRMLSGTGAVTVDADARTVRLEIDSPMGLTTMLMPLTGGMSWFLLADTKAEESMPMAVPAEIEGDMGGTGGAMQEMAPMPMPEPTPIRGKGAGDYHKKADTPLSKDGVPSNIAPNAAEPNRRDLDPGG